MVPNFFSCVIFNLPVVVLFCSTRRSRLATDLFPVERNLSHVSLIFFATLDWDVRMCRITQPCWPFEVSRAPFLSPPYVIFRGRLFLDAESDHTYSLANHPPFFSLHIPGL